MTAFLKNKGHYLLLALLALIGVFTAGSYGIAWDEPLQRDIGEVCYNYVFHNDLFYFSYEAKDHGPAFELFLLFLEKTAGLTDSRSIYVMRHIVTHLFFLAGALYLYKLVWLLYQKRWLAWMGLLFLLLHPSIYSHSFVNSKDIPFLTILIFFFYQFFLAFRDRKVYRFALLGLFCALMISMRVVGVLFAGLSIGFILLDVLLNRKEPGTLKTQSLLLLVFVLSSLGFTLAVWPLLWQHPLAEFGYVFKSFSKFNWGGQVLFKGQSIMDKNIGWDYIPTWFCINTPIMYLVCGFAGMILFLARRLRSMAALRLTHTDKNNLLYLCSFFAPLLAVFILHSTVFDTWRHLFFIYLPFILLAMHALNTVAESRVKPVLNGLLALSFGLAGWAMLSHFPLQYVYFNETVSLHRQNDYIRNRYDMDYWGLGYLQSLNYILAIDKREEIRVNGANYPARSNVMMLPEASRKRIVYVDELEQADYFITNYRGHPQDYTEGNLQELHALYVYGNKVNSVFRLTR